MSAASSSTRCQAAVLEPSAIRGTHRVAGRTSYLARPRPRLPGGLHGCLRWPVAQSSAARSAGRVAICGTPLIGSESEIERSSRANIGPSRSSSRRRRRALTARLTHLDCKRLDKFDIADEATARASRAQILRHQNYNSSRVEKKAIGAILLRLHHLDPAAEASRSWLPAPPTIPPRSASMRRRHRRRDVVSSPYAYRRVTMSSAAIASARSLSRSNTATTTADDRANLTTHAKKRAIGA